jgi:hypothetical protein
MGVHLNPLLEKDDLVTWSSPGATTGLLVWCYGEGRSGQECRFGASLLIRAWPHVVQTMQ